MEPLSIATDTSRPHLSAELLAQANKLFRAGRLDEAHAGYLKVVEIAPDDSSAHNNLGCVRQEQGDPEGAVTFYREALRLAPRLRVARHNLTTCLVRLGRSDECIDLWCADDLLDADDVAWLDRQSWLALLAHDLSAADEYARVHAAVRLGSAWYPRSSPPSRTAPLESRLTIPKLRHDMEQFRYLQRRALLGEEFTDIITAYQETISRLESAGEQGPVPMDAIAQRAIGHVYGRIVYVRDTPRVPRALSDAWDAVEVENRYIDQPPGVVVIDDFLSSEALGSLQSFCLESTVWNGNRYAHGRLGAFFRDGFTCPLLLQIAEEVRDALPRVIGKRHPLRQLWAFKNESDFPADSNTHADFAAVNLNFWITPTDANLDTESGGLVVYGVDAPPDWDFATYNSRREVIEPYLRQQHAKPFRIPYRQNRAILFNSDLFHGTDGLHFRPGFENRRVNITMLYGERADDEIHRGTSHASPGAGRPSAAWRSPVFTRHRGDRP
ncbi:tetratricopeptide repeat protein [Streptomyces vietnamensis]|uniref:tetratricopeptide repeat protein n=1 Tax=Streptomyces vietnamensis TaxID=362257 RepID=UPI0037BCC95D